MGLPELSVEEPSGESPVSDGSRPEECVGVVGSQACRNIPQTEVKGSLMISLGNSLRC